MGHNSKNEILQNICKQYNITQTFIFVQHPASNGIVERAKNKILDVLRHVVSQLYDSWQDRLPHVAASINGSINAFTGKTPPYIIYGSEKRLPYDLLLQPRIPVCSLDDYAKNQLKAFQIIHESVRRNLQASRPEMIQRQHMSATPVTLSQ
ncbi:Retrovirus-related Pol polyprotein [Portunus trituberculatus]|uniref:Retrovirus-related Pol polyprotein n=1 Tax=Portunus trituberculatus TaxID=210409 RepID=A0A5B7IMP1_PORTR|nr:Retrovirus-related Pol polyprotein [Portunus trituberculatus]